MFDIYFDLSVGGWVSWKQVFLYIQEETKPEKSRKNMLQNVVQTQDYLRTTYLMERLLEQQHSTMLIGRTGVGKSIVLKNFLMTQDGTQKRTNIEMMTFSFSASAGKTQELIEHRLCSKGGQKVLTPPDNKNLIYLIDDINLAYKDKWGHQGALELLRQWFDHKGWFNHGNIFLKAVKQICFASTVSARHQFNNVGRGIVDERLTWHWAGIGMTNFEGCHIEQIYQVVLNKIFANCTNKQVTQHAPVSILKASTEFVKMFNSTVRPSPTSFLKKINQRHMIYILKGILEIPQNYFKMQENVAFLWMNEVCRTVLDRFGSANEKRDLYEKAKIIASNCFRVRERVFPTTCDEPYFCYGLPDQEDAYNEKPSESKMQSVLTECLMEYNKHHAGNEIDVIIFNTVVDKAVKISRSLRQQCANTILIADEGSGAYEIVKMAIKLAKCIDYELFAKDSELKDDWRQGMKAIMNNVGLESHSRAVLHVQPRDLATDDTLDALDSIAAHGENFNFFSKEEMDSVVA